MNDAFTPEQQKSILKKTVSADKNPIYTTDPGNDTEDMVFLLSIDEAERYLSNNSARQAQTTAYAVSMGAYTQNNTGNTWWWLRSPGSSNYYALYVNIDGSIILFGDNFDGDYGAVRPALWINL